MIEKASYICDEFILLQFENLPLYNEQEDRIDRYWDSLFDNNNKYQHLCEFIRTVLILSLGNAAVERGFSISKHILGEDKTAMSVRMLNSILNIKDGLGRHENRPDIVPITSQLLNMGRRARQSYHTYLENEKRKREEEEKRTKEQKTKEENENKMREEPIQSKAKIIDLDKKIKETESEIDIKKASADKLLEEANNKLKHALLKNDLTGVQIAQGMIDGAVSLRHQERNKEIEIKTIRKRKSNIITTYFEKKSKIC